MGGACCNRKAIEEPVKKKKSLKEAKLIEFSLGMDEFKKEYEYISILGNGSYGTVKLYRGSKNNHLIFAVKSINKGILDATNAKMIYKEVKILRMLDHPNVVKFYGTYEDEQFLNIVMEYIPGDNLTKLANKQKSKSFSENDTFVIISCLMQTIEYLHNTGIIHRDIKPSNILFRQQNNLDSLKLIDFGISLLVDDDEDDEELFEEEENNKKKDSTGSKSPGKQKHHKKNNSIKLSYKDVYGKEIYQYKNQIGTPYYMSPESIKGDPCEKSDCWSVGVLLYQMLTGQLPFKGEKKEKVFNEICKCKYDKSILQSFFSEEVQDLIENLLKVDVEERLSIKDALKHSWFAIFRDDEDHNKKLDKNVVNNLISFRDKNVFQKEVSYFLAKLNSSNDVNKLDKLFKELDVNKTGLIDYKDLCQGLENYGIEETDIKKIANSLDFHKDGKIQYSEFITAAVSLSSETNSNLDEQLSLIFKLFDENKTGYITSKSVIHALEKENLPVNQQEMQEFFVNQKKEKLSFEEFKKLIKKELLVHH